MKKIALFLLVLLTSIAAQAGDLTGIKIYINPGHGGYDSNDRSVWTIPVPETWTNPNGFWESKSNLVKALALNELLQSAGATVILSRTDNTSGIRDGAQFAGGGDRDLSEIAEEANANNVDHFLSIHSNALNTTTNYLLLLYHGDDNNPTVPASLPMAQNSGPIQFDNPLTVWSSSAINLRGDFTFYGDRLGLGVLRPLTVPGFLSEGSFHDYPPETHRLCNDDYCKLEALRFFKHFHSYYNRDMPVNGTIAGWVKSGNEIINVPKFTYRANSDDQWLPLNGVSVKLLSADGSTELQTYTTDDWYNGIYAFYNLAPGNYKIKVQAQNYETKTVDVTLAESSIAYAKMQINNIRLAIPDYPDPDQENGIVALPNYDFEANGSLTNPEWLQNNHIKRALYRNAKLYVLTTESKIIVADAQTANIIKELNMNGIDNIGDIAFSADNFLLGCNKVTVPFESSDVFFKVYTWDNDDSTPSVLFQTSKAGNWTNSVIGETFAVSGSRWNCKIYTTSLSSSPSYYRIVAYQYVEGATDVNYRYMMDNGYTTTLWGEHPVFAISPNGTNDHLYIDSEVMLPVEYQFDWGKPDREPMVKIGDFAEVSGYTVPAIANGANFFRNAKHSYLAMPVSETNASKVGVVLFDVNDGLDKAVKVSTQYPAEGLGETPSAYMTAIGRVDGYDIELLVLAKNQGMARYKTTDAPVANIFAGELSIATDQSFRFTLNENAQSVFIAISKEGEILTSHNAGALTKGVHSIANPFGTTDFDAWSVTAKARSVSRPVKISNDNPVFQFYSARGVAVDNTPESPYFGRIYVTETAGGQVTVGAPPNARSTQRGIYILNAAHEDTTGQGADSYSGEISWANNNNTGYQYGPMRPTVAPDGKLYISDSSYGNAGIYILDPAMPSDAFKPVFGGTRNTANGQVTENGVTIHNPVQNCYVTGSGTNTQLYTLDRTASPVTGKIQRYDIGELTAPWTAAPSATVFNDPNNRMQNSYGTIAYDSHGGWWLAQYRAGAGGTAVPTLIHATNDVEDYNAAENWPSGYQGTVAVNRDGSLLALGTEPGKAQVFDVTYDANNKPALTPKFTIEWGGTASYVQDAAFDAAGNLYLISNGNERLMIYAMPKVENSYTTHASVGKRTSIHTPKIQDNVTVYPNPVISELVIDGQGTNLKTCILYDLSGKILHSTQINSTLYRVPASGLNAGIYILKIQTANETVVKRIIKK